MYFQAEPDAEAGPADGLLRWHVLPADLLQRDGEGVQGCVQGVPRGLVRGTQHQEANHQV